MQLPAKDIEMDVASLQSELERLADLLDQAAASVRRIAGQFRDDAPASGDLPGPESLPVASDQPATDGFQSVTAPPPPSSHAIERLIPPAAEILAGEPDRIWKEEELVRAALTSSEDDGLSYTEELATHLIRRLVTRGFLWKAGPERYRAVVAERPVEIEPEGLPGEIVRLEREIDGSRGHLAHLEGTQVNAQISLWGARARAVQDRMDEIPEAWQERLRWVFGRLSTIVRDTRCGWVNPLNRDWSTDWGTYVAVQRGRLTDLPPSLSGEHEAEFYAAELRGLLLSNRRVAPADADIPILDGIDVLGEENPLVAECLNRFGDPRLDPLPTSKLRRHKRPARAGEADVPVEVPGEVLSMTRGRRALIAGGQGAREDQRQSLESALELDVLNWETVERGQVAPLQRMAERIAGGSYDLVFFLAAFTSHKGTIVVDACREAGVPLIFLNRGYNINRVIHEILEQQSQPSRGSTG